MCKISVIVPVYNAQLYIEKCMESLVRQTYVDYEIIVINDGSEDNSGAILEAYQNKYKTIKLINQQNQGQATARNVGIDNANGEFISFVDSDDYVSLDFLEILMTEQTLTNADIVWCDAKAVKKYESYKLSANSFVTENCFKDYILNNSGPCRKIIRTSIIKENNLYFPLFRSYEDIAVVPIYALYSKTISYVDDVLYYYIMHDGSVMHQNTFSDKLLCVFDSMDKVNSGFKKVGKWDKYKDEIEYLNIDHLLHAASLRFFMFDEGFKEIVKIVEIMRSNFPDWKNNKYFKEQGWKYRFICRLFFHKKFRLLKILLK